MYQDILLNTVNYSPDFVYIYKFIDLMHSQDADFAFHFKVFDISFDSNLNCSFEKMGASAYKFDFKSKGDYFPYTDIDVCGINYEGSSFISGFKLYDISYLFFTFFDD